MFDWIFEIEEFFPDQIFDQNPHLRAKIFRSEKKIFPMIQLGSKAKKPFIWVPKNPQPGGFGRGRIFLHFPWVRTLLKAEVAAGNRPKVTPALNTAKWPLGKISF